MPRKILPGRNVEMQSSGIYRLPFILKLLILVSSNDPRARRRLARQWLKFQDLRHVHCVQVSNVIIISCIAPYISARFINRLHFRCGHWVIVKGCSHYPLPVIP